MIQLIPLTNTLTNKELKQLNNTNTLFITSINLINKLLQKNNYPVKNRKIAITNILSFLSFCDRNLSNNEENLITVSAQTIASFFQMDHYKKYLEILRDLRVMTNVPYTDKDGNKLFFWDKKGVAKQYRLHHGYVYDDLCIVIIEQERKEVTVKIDCNTVCNKKMVNTIKKVEIDYKAAILAEIDHHIENNTSLNKLRIRINKILSLNQEKRSIRKGIKVDRLYHSLSNLSRIARPFLTVKGLGFNCIDIKNCQPLLLCYILKQRGLNLDSNYINDCEQATFYEQFITPKRTRDQVKVLLYRSIYFAFKTHKPINKEFKQQYPLTWASLSALNKEKIGLASLLQNAEASIFNTLEVKSKFYYTLFDAIYFIDSDETEDLKKQLENKFLRFGLLPKFGV